MFYWLTIADFARREHVARNTVLAWIDNKRIDTWTPAKGVRLIKSETKRPDKWRPWEIKRQEYISRDKM
jgi:hypothetical protein